MARAAARRTSVAMAAASDADTSYRELVVLHRRRARAKIAAVSAVLLAVLIVVFAGSGGVSLRRSEPVAPRPTDTKAFRAAPPFCGPEAFGVSLSEYVKVGGDCPTGPGRYLSAEAGYGSSPAFAFTLPKGWTIQAIGGGSVRPGLGGLLLRSNATGAGLVLTQYPTEVAESGRTSQTVGASPAEIARRLAGRGDVQPTRVVATTLGGRIAYRVDLVARPGTAHSGHCLIGDSCAVTFALAQDPYPGRSYIGLVPGVPSTALVLPAPIFTVAWTWGDPDVDHDLAGLLSSIDFAPPIICHFEVEPCVH
jgi:hypothetical protein